MHLGTGESIAFWIIGAVAVLSALGVLFSRNIFHAAIFLILSFLAVAGLFVTLSADFIGVVQMLVYAGAISILLIFAILLTRDVESGNPSNKYQLPAFFLGGLFFATLVVIFVNTDWIVSNELPNQDTTAALGDALLGPYVLPFEVASVLLLAAMIGAIVIARGREE